MFVRGVVHDHARPDASAQELAQVEPRLRRAGAGDFFRSHFLQQNPTGAISGETVATIEGRDITAGEFRRTYDAQLQAYRNAYGGNVSEQLLKQLGVDQQIIGQLVDRQAALAEAEGLGIRASDEEVRQRIFATPAFLENGAFIGEQRYQQLLRSQRPPMTAAQFENAIREELVIAKLQAVLTDWLSVTDKEVEQEYRVRNDKVKLAVVTFMADSFRPDATASDAEVAAYFAAAPGRFHGPRETEGSLPARRHRRAPCEGRRSRRPTSYGRTTTASSSIRRPNRSVRATFCSRPRARTRQP